MSTSDVPRDGARTASDLDEAAAAVERRPDDLDLRVRLADLLVLDGRTEEAVPHLAHVLSERGDDPRARVLMAQALSVPRPAGPRSRRTSEPLTGGFDWAAAEQDLDGLVPPMFVDDLGGAYLRPRTLRLSDVGGMAQVKRRLTAAFVAPLRNRAVRDLYSADATGGMLLYGPPGCGKSLLARALAGELEATFVELSLAALLDQHTPTAEDDVREAFATALDTSPTVLLLRDVDALRQRSSMRTPTINAVVEVLLAQLDEVVDDPNVIVVGTTHQPWDVDPVLLRAGRLDRTALVLPPDAEARTTIWRHHLAGRPIAGIDLAHLVERTEGHTWAAIAHTVDEAADIALVDATEHGRPRMITMDDLETAMPDAQPSLDRWFDTARNVVAFAEEDGVFGDLQDHLRRTIWTTRPCPEDDRS